MPSNHPELHVKDSNFHRTWVSGSPVPLSSLRQPGPRSVPPAAVTQDETEELSLLSVLRQQVGRELRLVYAPWFEAQRLRGKPMNQPGLKRFVAMLGRFP